jgi:hypothetical protein
LFTICYTIHFKGTETPRDQLLHLLWQYIYDFFLFQVSTVRTLCIMGTSVPWIRVIIPHNKNMKAKLEFRENIII